MHCCKKVQFFVQSAQYLPIGVHLRFSGMREDAFYAKCGLQSAEWHRGRKGGGRNNSSAQSPLIHRQITTIIIRPITTIIIGTITTIIIGTYISLPHYPDQLPLSLVGLGQFGQRYGSLS